MMYKMKALRIKIPNIHYILVEFILILNNIISKNIDDSMI